jgi:nitrite reductase/ring-hydroxylating ferredoxin subunit
MTTSPAEDSARVASDDAGRYLRYMAEFIGFGEADARAVRATKQLVERHLPEIVTDFYERLLRYPPTRAFFLRPDGTVDEQYLELRMRHQIHFWLRTADATLDDDYARYVDYVGRAHTSRGADERIYVGERYVIGMVGVVQHAISRALLEEPDGQEPLRSEAVEAWDKMLMVVLELLARAYGHERTAETFEALVPVDRDDVVSVAERAFAATRGPREGAPVRAVRVAAAAEIPDGERKLVEVDGLSVGVFHVLGEWHAIRNYCLHRGGPVATGALDGATITCPWHGFRYDVVTGRCLADPMAVLDRYAVEVRDGEVYVPLPEHTGPPAESAVSGTFEVAEVPPGVSRVVTVGGRPVLAHNVDGVLFATASECPHAFGPLADGKRSGPTIECPLHGSVFDVTTGEVVTGPATEPLATFRVEVDGAVGRVVATET